MKKKTVVLLLALVLVFGCAVGGTVAWLTAKTDTVTNTFTAGNINITLTETTGDTYKMVPGAEIPKDPVVTVKAGSEACWLFVKAEESNSGAYLTFELADGWLEVDDVDNVFYREVDASNTDQAFPVIKDNKVTVNTSVTKDMMDAIDGINADGSPAAAELANRPTLTATAYAVQKTGFGTAALAWEEAVKLDTP